MRAVTAAKTAILIEDDQVDQIVYGRVIKRSGLIENTRSFRYAEEALDFLAQADREQIDVIFLDINLPGMSGLEFLERATDQLGPRIAKAVVIMLTTSLNPEDVEKARSFGVVKGYLHKPLTVEGLQGVFEQLRSAEPE